MKSLVTQCPGIKELRLKEVGNLGDPFLRHIHAFKKGLRYLDLSDPSHSCSEDAVIALLRAVGRDLTHLNLSKHDKLTDRFLDKGLHSHISRLESLTLSHLPELTDAGVGQFFSKWTKNTPLLSLDMSRNPELGTQALDGVLEHSGKRLENLNINGWKDTTDKSLKMIGLVAFELKTLDVGWCRMVDDFVVQIWLQGQLKRGARNGGCRNLEELKVWGCNKITHNCPRKVRTSFLYGSANLLSDNLYVEGCIYRWC
jgi:DNA repair protein RAD7